MSARNAVYLDFNAGSPLRLEAKLAVAKALGLSVDLSFDGLQAGSGIETSTKTSLQNNQLSQSPSTWIANASSIHAHGRQAKKALSEAREAIAKSISNKIDPEDLVFTSSCSEANQSVVRSVFESSLKTPHKPFHWVTTSVEHDSNIQLISWLKERGARVDVIGVDSSGQLRDEDIQRYVDETCSLVSAIWVNNETGVITPIKKLSQLCVQKAVPLHVDGAQAWGKIPLNDELDEISYLTLSAHKIGGLAGFGVVWSKKKFSSVIFGKQERGRRGGTENIVGAVACGAAAKSVDPAKMVSKVGPLRDALEQEILRRIPSARINGAFKGDSGVLIPRSQNPDFRVCNTLNVSFADVDGESLVMAMDLAGYSVSSGSACASGVLEPSHVLMAMGLTVQEAKASLRVSLGQTTTSEECAGFVQALERIIEQFSIKREYTSDTEFSHSSI